jgi:hypothetical protein
MIAMTESADEIDAQADELEANEIIRAATADAEILRLRARAKRLRTVAHTAVVQQPAHLTRAQYAHRSNVSEATVSRWIAAGMPVVPVGTACRIDPPAADLWRRTRPRTATTPAKKSIAANDADDLDVSRSLSAAGLTRAR